MSNSFPLFRRTAVVRVSLPAAGRNGETSRRRGRVRLSMNGTAVRCSDIPAGEPEFLADSGFARRGFAVKSAFSSPLGRPVSAELLRRSPKSAGTAENVGASKGVSVTGNAVRHTDTVGAASLRDRRSWKKTPKRTPGRKEKCRNGCRLRVTTRGTINGGIFPPGCDGRTGADSISQ